MKPKKYQIVPCDEPGCKYKVDPSKGEDGLNDAAFEMIQHMQQVHKLDEDAANEKINTMSGWPDEEAFLD